MKFAADRPYADPETAARKLLELVLRNDIDVGQHTNIGKVNQDFLNLGGSVAEYIAGRDRAIAHHWFELDRSRSRIVLLQAGSDLATKE